MAANSSTVSQQQEEFVLLWKQFNAEFPSEEDCIEAIYTKYNDQAMKCSFCGGSEIKREYGARTGQCTSCKKAVWITAGTFFHRMRRARPWLAAIWLIERGQGLSAGLLHRLVDIAPSTAWLLLKKLHLVINSALLNQPDRVCEASANFLAVICKRSTETPAGSHPAAEQSAMETKAGNSMNATPRYLDWLAACIKFIRQYFHGSSRKYLQFFLAAYWCKTDREKWPDWSLLKACRNFRAIGEEEIISFISPLLLNLVPKAETTYNAI